MKPLPFRKLGSVGVNTDMPHYETPHNGFTDCNNTVFRDQKAKKLRGFDVLSDLGLPALKIQRGWEAGVPVLFVATATDIWKYLSGVWTNVSRSAPGAYGAADWDSVLFGDYVIFTTTNEPPQVYDAVTGRFIDMVNWPATLRCERLRVFGSFLIALGITEGSAQYLYGYLWSDPAPINGLPGSWDYADPTSLAGIAEVPAETGQVLDGGELGTAFMLYTTHACHELRLVGGQNRIARRIVHHRGLLSVGAFAAFDSYHFVVGQDSTYTHSGGPPKSVGRNRVDTRLYKDLGSPREAIVTADAKNHEIRVFMHSASISGFTPTLIWNYFDNTFAFGSVPGEVVDAGSMPTPATGVTWEDLQNSGTLWSELGMTWAELGGADGSYSLVWLAGDGNIYTESLNFNVATVAGQPAFLERIGIDLDEVAPRPIGDYIFADRIVPQIDGSGIVKFQIGRMDSINEGVTWGPVIEFDLDSPDDEVTFMVETTYFCYRVLSDTPGYWNFSGFDLYAQPSGEQ